MKKVTCLSDYKVEHWLNPYTVKQGDILYLGGYLRGYHPVLHTDSKQSFVVFNEEQFNKYFKIEE